MFNNSKKLYIPAMQISDPCDEQNTTGVHNVTDTRKDQAYNLTLFSDEFR